MSITISIENNEMAPADLFLALQLDIVKPPVELKLSNHNFKTLWDELCLRFDYSGSIDPRKIDIFSIKVYSPYYNELKLIVDEAILRGRNITWG